MVIDLKGKKILIVDDELELRAILRREIESFGAKVFEANGPREAIEILAGQGVDAILTDYKMPSGFGTDILKWLQVNKLSTPVILMSGWVEFTTSEAYELGIYHVVHKPFRIAEILVILSKAAKLQFTNHRRFYRANVYLPVDLAIPPEKAREKTHLINLSKGGMCIRWQHSRLLIGAQVHFNIFQKGPQEQGITGVGVCRWEREDFTEQGSTKLAGIEFTKVEEEAATELEHLVTDLVNSI